MLQRFAFNASGNARMRLLDLEPDRDTPSPHPDGRRWQPGDPEQVEFDTDYQDGVLACERNPRRYKPAAMTDEEHREMIAHYEREQRKVRRA